MISMKVNYLPVILPGEYFVFIGLRALKRINKA